MGRAFTFDGGEPAEIAVSYNATDDRPVCMAGRSDCYALYPRNNRAASTQQHAGDASRYALWRFFSALY